MFKNILIVVDLSDLKQSKQLVKTVLDMHQNKKDCVYRVVSVVPAPTNTIVSSFLPKNFDKDVLAEANKALHSFTASIFDKESKVQHIVAYGTIYEEINRIAQEKKTDLIVMMATKNNKEGLSSDTVKVARYGKTPILILR